jgi:hypothetical protein
MEINLPVFDLRNMKRYFFIFLVVNLGICVAAVFLTGFFSTALYPNLFKGAQSWILLGVLFAISTVYGSKAKKELNAILETDLYEEKFRKFEIYHKRRCVWNTFSLFLTCCFFVLTNRNFLFYFLIAQLILTLIQYPSRRLIRRVLKNDDIIFT